MPKCKDVLQKLRESLGADAAWFEQAVDVLQAPDYYKIVHHPMWFAKIQAKLEGEEYATPNDFGEDMRQVWKNCFLYNPKVTIVHGIGLRGDRKFEELWANSGLSSERSKRATAGVAAPKFAPELEAAKPNQLKAEPGVSRKPGGGGGAAAGPGGASKKQPTPSGNRVSEWGQATGSALCACMSAEVVAPATHHMSWPAPAASPLSGWVFTASQPPLPPTAATVTGPRAPGPTTPFLWPLPVLLSPSQANGSRAYSHEVTSGGKTREKGLSAERRAQIANDLQNALGDGSLSEEQLNGAPSAFVLRLPAPALRSRRNAAPAVTACGPTRAPCMRCNAVCGCLRRSGINMCCCSSLAHPFPAPHPTPS